MGQHFTRLLIERCQALFAISDRCGKRPLCGIPDIIDHFDADTFQRQLLGSGKSLAHHPPGSDDRHVRSGALNVSYAKRHKVFSLRNRTLFESQHIVV